MKEINAQQLAFILDIKKEDARAKMVRAIEKSKGIELRYDEVATARRNVKNKIEDNHPQFISISVLSEFGNLPTLQEMINDIQLNYLNRPASKKYILVDYPEKFIKKCEKEGKDFPVKIDIPPALKSMLPDETKKRIYQYWTAFKTADFKPRFKVPQNG